MRVRRRGQEDLSNADGIWVGSIAIAASTRSTCGFGDRTAHVYVSAHTPRLRQLSSHPACGMAVLESQR